MNSRSLFTAVLAFVLTTTAALAQTANDSNEGSLLTGDPANPGAYHFSWFGHAGRTYFLQQSQDLKNWMYLPMLEPGADQSIGWGFTSSGNRFFLRLKHTNANGTDPFSADSDDDGVSDWDELLQATDPFSAADTDHNGLPDDSEIKYFRHIGVDPNDDPDGDGFTNLQEYLNRTDPTDPQNEQQAKLSVLRGNNQKSLPNHYVAVPFMLQATDSSGQSLASIQVTVNVTSGGGHVATTPSGQATASSFQLTTDEDGLVFFWYQHPSAWGVSSTITASFSSGNVIRNTVVRASTVQVAVPANDSFASAEVITGNAGIIAGASPGASKENGEQDHVQTQGGTSVWYKWQAPSTGSFNFNTTGSSFDTLLAIYTGSALSNLSEAASNNDDDTTPDYSMTSSVVFRAVAGATYYIAVDGYHGQAGAIVLNWGGNTGPNNDYFQSAASISGITGTISGANAGATREPGEPLHADQLGKSSVWYHWQAPQNGQMMLNTSGSAIDTYLAVYKGNTIQSLTPVVANDDETPGSITTSRTSFSVAGGVIYYIAIDSPYGIYGNHKLNWNLGTAPANDDFANAQSLSGDTGSVTGTNRFATKEMHEPDHYYGHSAGMSAWYTWTAPSDGFVYFNTSPSSFSTIMAGYTGGSLSTLEQASGGYGYMSLYVSAGVAYHIVIDGYVSDTSQSGDIALSWTFYPNGSNAQSGSNLSTAHGHGPANPDLPAYKQRMAAAAAGVALNDDPACDEGPPEANQGDAGHWTYAPDGTPLFAASATVYVSLPSNGDPACSQTIPVTHRIVTRNTPRARDLSGVLMLKLVRGDPSCIEISTEAGAYTYGSPISVIETGHVGCGIHHWHTGDMPFTYVGKKTGVVVLEAEVDPDPDDGGDGVPNQTCTITINVIKLTYTLDPPPAFPPSAKTDWPDQDEVNTKQNVTVVTDPVIDPAKIILTLDDYFVSGYNDGYQPGSTGELLQDTTNPALWIYTAFKEPKTEKHPLQKKVRITAHFYDQVNNQYLDLCPHLRFSVVTVFNWYANAHKHGPGGDQHTTPTDADYTNAYKYAMWKYDLKLLHSKSIAFDATWGHDGLSRWGGAVNKAMITLGPSVFGGRTSSEYAENWTAATIIHEDFHGSQNTGGSASQKWYRLWHTLHDKDLLLEIPAYTEELRRGPEVGLSTDDAEAIQAIIDRIHGGGTAGEE